MGVTTGKIAFQPNIVTDGLVLNLDAINPNSYPQSGTIWYDTSGNGNNGTLTNGTSWTPNGSQTSFSFDGSNDYVLIPYKNIFNIGVNDFTYSVWFYPNNNDSFKRIFSLGVFNTTGNFQFERQSGGGVVVHVNGSFVVYSSSNPANFWYNYTVTRVSGTVYVYKNGINFSSGVQSGGITTTSNITIGNDLSYGVFFNGRIPLTHFYNRALTSSEVLQNYNALKSRFGLS